LISFFLFVVIEQFLVSNKNKNDRKYLGKKICFEHTSDDKFDRRDELTNFVSNFI
jgi:hypothetical protein